MKINDAELLLGISKANIRFYEKEGLITPERSENGYRNYSDADIERLKDIIILRKLGIPVQQIADVLDGILPLQDAVDASIHGLKEEIERLNGSLALCRQLKQEQSASLDTQRYWELIQEKERQGDRFFSIVHDYWEFMRPITEWLYWYIPEEGWNQPWKFLEYMLIACLIFAGFDAFVSAENYLTELFGEINLRIRTLLIWAAVLLPAYLIMKKNKEKGGKFRFITIVFMILLSLILTIVELTLVVST